MRDSATMPRRRLQPGSMAARQTDTPVVIERFIEPCALLLLQERAACGYEIFQRIRLDCHYPAVDLPNVYRTLRQLEATGMVAATDRIGPRQKQLYRLTPEGRHYLADWMASLRQGLGIEGQLIERYEQQQESEASEREPTRQTDHDTRREGETRVYKAVIQYNVAGHEEQVLGQLDHLLHEFANDTVDLVVVAHGEGIGLLSRPEYQDRITNLHARGVTFLGCAVTLQRLQLTPDDLVPGAASTSGALAEIIRRQHEGYAYLRPF